MNRRGFLRLLGGAGAAAVVGADLEELLAPRKTYFLPPSTPFVANGVIGRYEGVIFIPELWSNEMVKEYTHNLVLTNRINSHYPAPRRRPIGSYAAFDSAAQLLALG